MRKLSILALLWAMPLSAAPAGNKTAPVQAKVSCVAVNHPVVFVKRNADGTQTSKEAEDWWVTCTITRGDKKIDERQLTIPHPTDFRSAMLAIEEFQRKQAPEIAKGNNAPN